MTKLLKYRLLTVSGGKLPIKHVFFTATGKKNFDLMFRAHKCGPDINLILDLHKCRNLAFYVFVIAMMKIGRNILCG